jgi:hypothetical protein
VKLASINLQKLVLSPTGSINHGFILREDLLLCSSYLPLGVPKWADIYTPSPIHALQTDNGKEFHNLTVCTLLATHGTVFRLAYPYTSQKNSRVERILCTLNDCVHTLLFHVYMPPCFWSDALATATLLFNIRPCRSRWQYTPHHLMFGMPFSYTDLRIFVCRCYPSAAATAVHNLSPRSLPCVFLGYPANTEGYCCYDPVSHRVITSRHIYFDELLFPFK